MFDISVGWDKEAGYAQIGLIQTGGEPKIRVGDSKEVFDSLWSTLGPENIEQLIKLLRKVKRQTFSP